MHYYTSTPPSITNANLMNSRNEEQEKHQFLVLLTHTRPSSPTPGRHQASPAVIPHSLPTPEVPFIFIDKFPAVIPIIYIVCPTPAILTSTLPSSDAPYSPPHNSGPPISPAVCLNSHCPMCLTIPRKAKRAWPGGPT